MYKAGKRWLTGIICIGVGTIFSTNIAFASDNSANLSQTDAIQQQAQAVNSTEKYTQPKLSALKENVTDDDYGQPYTNEAKFHGYDSSTIYNDYQVNPESTATNSKNTGDLNYLSNIKGGKILNSKTVTRNDQQYWYWIPSSIQGKIDKIGLGGLIAELFRSQAVSACIRTLLVEVFNLTNCSSSSSVFGRACLFI